MVAASSSLPLPQPGLHQPCPGRLHDLLVVALSSTWSSFLPIAARAVVLKRRCMRRDWFPPGPSDSRHPQAAAQTLQHCVQAAHSPVTSLACPPQGTPCFCPNKSLARPHLIPLLGVPSLSCVCALSALQNPALFTTHSPPQKKKTQTLIYLVTGYYTEGL